MVRAATFSQLSAKDQGKDTPTDELRAPTARLGILGGAFRRTQDRFSNNGSSTPPRVSGGSGTWVFLPQANVSHSDGS